MNTRIHRHTGVEGIEWKRPHEWGNLNQTVCVWSGSVDPDDVAQVCMYMYMSYMYVRMYTCISCIYICIYNINIFIHISICIFMYICIYIYSYTYIIYICMYICIQIYVCIGICICI